MTCIWDSKDPKTAQKQKNEEAHHTTHISDSISLLLYSLQAALTFMATTYTFVHNDDWWEVLSPAEHARLTLPTDGTVDCYVATVAPRACGALVQRVGAWEGRQKEQERTNGTLSTTTTSFKTDLSHLRRVRPRPDGQLDVLLGAVADVECAFDDDDSFPDRWGLQRDQIRIEPLSARMAETKAEQTQFNQTWPTIFAPRRTVAYRRQQHSLAHNEKELAQLLAGVEAALHDDSGGVVICDAMGRIHGRAREEELRQIPPHAATFPSQNPLATPILFAIQAVSRQERAMACDKGLQHPDFTTGQYLCTGLTCYTVHEPSALEAMALTHARINRVVFGVPAKEKIGGFTHHCIHHLPDTNHRYRALACQPDSELGRRCRAWQPKPITQSKAVESLSEFKTTASLSNDEKEEVTSPATTALHGDILVRVLSYLPWRQVVHCRRLSRPWQQAVAATPVVEVDVYQRLDIAQIAHCFPRLQSLRIHHSVGVTDEHLRESLSLLRHLTRLECREAHSLRYSFAEMRQLTHLRRLNLHNNTELEWNLECVASDLPNLIDLRCINNRRLQGRLGDLETLSQLEVLDVSGCRQVTGNWLDLSHLTKVRWVGFSRTAVGGDLRKLKPGMYPALQLTGLGEEVYGAREFNRVADAPAILRARHQLIQQSSEEIPLFPFQLRLAETSPDYHERIEQRLYTSERDPPFCIENVQVGCRRGWRWSNYLGGVCDIRWLDPEPQDNDAFEVYAQELAQLMQESAQSIFLGFLDPPTPSEYELLCQQK